MMSIVLEAPGILSEPLSLLFARISNRFRLRSKVSWVTEFSVDIPESLGDSWLVSRAKSLLYFSLWCRSSPLGLPACRIVDDQVRSGTITKHEALSIAINGMTSSSPSAWPLHIMRLAWIAAVPE